MRALSAVVAIAVLATAGCPRRRGAGGHDPPSDPYPGREARLQGVLARELEIEVLEGYDLTTLELTAPATAVSRRVGAVQFGVGPDDVYTASDGTIERWPLLPVADATRLDVVESKRLEMHLSADLTAAWTLDEVSYRVPGCRAADGYRTLVIPLRVTGLYIRDGERWVHVLEHLSYPQRIADLIARADAQPRVRRLQNGMDPRPQIRPVTVAVQRAIAVDLSPPDRATLFATDATAMAMWPADPELRASAILQSAGLAESFDAEEITLDGYRIGMGPDPTGGVGSGTVAWMAANITVYARRAIEAPASEPGTEQVETVPLRLRATYVLELRKIAGAIRWQVVQSHVSSPLDDRELLRAVMGEAAPDDGGVAEDAPWPWQIECL